MGREVRRVSLDFDWPLDKRWPGFCYEPPDCGIASCPDAHGTNLRWSKEAMCAFHRALWDDGYPKLEPPAGDGWQLWETVTEGSPISPVFPTAEGLVDWLCSPAYNWGISGPMQREQAQRFVQAGWAPSMVFSLRTGLIAGENFVGGAS